MPYVSMLFVSGSGGGRMLRVCGRGRFLPFMEPPKCWALAQDHLEPGVQEASWITSIARLPSDHSFVILIPLVLQCSVILASTCSIVRVGI